MVAVQRPAESSLEIGQDNIKVYPPSHIKDAEEKIHKLKEEIEKQRREFDTLQKELLQQKIKHTQFEEYVHKKLAELNIKQDKASEHVELEIKEAFKTASSWNKKQNINQVLTNSDVPHASRASARAPALKVTKTDS